MQLLALTCRNAGANSVVRNQVESHGLTHPSPQFHSRVNNAAVARNNAAVAHGKNTDGTSLHDDHEGASLLDTPAPRRRPPVPTEYESTTAAYQPDNSSHFTKTSAAQSGMMAVQFAAKVHLIIFHVFHRL